MPPTNGTTSDEIRLERKIKGGKLLGCRARIDGGRIESVRFLGDFFLHPEQVLEGLEESLRGMDRGGALKAVRTALDSTEVEMVGVAPADFENLLGEAFDRGGSNA